MGSKRNAGDRMAQAGESSSVIPDAERPQSSLRSMKNWWNRKLNWQIHFRILLKNGRNGNDYSKFPWCSSESLNESNSRQFIVMSLRLEVIMSLSNEKATLVLGQWTCAWNKKDKCSSRNLEENCTVTYGDTPIIWPYPQDYIIWKQIIIKMNSGALPNTTMAAQLHPMLECHLNIPGYQWLYNSPENTIPQDMIFFSAFLFPTFSQADAAVQVLL